MVHSGDRTVKLSCYLLRESYRPSDVLRETEADVRYYRGNDGEGWQVVESLAEGQQASDRLAVTYRTTSQRPTDWQSMVGDWEAAADPNAHDFALGDRPDRGAVFFFRVGDPPRWCAWSFGRGWRYLLRQRLDPRFGVISALNDLTRAEDEAVFRKLQVRREAGEPQLVGRATFGDAPIGAFELDEVWDAIKSIGGRTVEGNMVYGALSLVESHSISEPDELSAISHTNLNKFHDVAYRERFRFLDQYVPVSDETIIETLDGHVAESLKEDSTTAAFAYPSAVASFGSRDLAVTVAFPGEYRTDGRTAIGSQVIATHGRLRNDTDQINLDSILRFYDDEGHETQATLRECLASQFTLEEVAYVLADGVYYEVNREFVATLDDYLLQRIDTLDSAPAYASTGEGAWLEEAVDTGQFFMIHPTTYSPEGLIGNVELADVISADGRMLHVKVGADTAAAAEVARQAMSSAEALLMYPNTAEWLRAQQTSPPFTGLELTLDHYPRPALGIALLGRSGDDMSRVSLFAKLALERAIRHLEGRSFDIQIYFVPRNFWISTPLTQGRPISQFSGRNAHI